MTIHLLIKCLLWCYRIVFVQSLFSVSTLLQFVSHVHEVIVIYLYCYLITNMRLLASLDCSTLYFTIWDEFDHRQVASDSSSLFLCAMYLQFWFMCLLAEL